MKYKHLFGIDFNVTEIKTRDLPVYLTARRSFFRMSHSEVDFILVKVSEREKFGVLAFEKQAKIIAEKYGIPVAFGFNNMTRSQRDSLLEKNIPFISETGQLYLPFLGMALRDQFVHPKEIKKEKMMPVTQALFLYLLYNGNDNPVLKKDAAEAIGVTRTSITRASDQLDVMGLITQEAYGKECRMITNEKGRNAFEKAKPYMINPVQQAVTIKSQKQYEIYPLSGESALAKQTMLGIPKIPARAVFKGKIDIGEIQDIDTRWDTDGDVMRLELWKYNPSLYVKNGVVDPISLCMCFENNVDERIEGAIAEYLEDYISYFTA